MLPQSLRFRVGFYVALVLLATLLLFAVLVVQQQRGALLRAAEDHVTQMSEAIVRSTRFAMLQNQPEYVHRIIQDVARGANIDRVRIFSKEGVIIDSTYPLEVGLKVDRRAEGCFLCHQSEQPPASLPQGLRARVFNALDGRRMLASMEVIRNEPSCSQASCHAHSPNQTVLGVLDIVYPLEDIDDSLRSSALTIIVLSAAFVYQLPFGEGRRWASTGGLVNALVGGWQMSTIFRYSSGLPLYFRSSFCNVPGQFRAACIPAIVDPSAVFAQDKGDFDPGRGPLFNAAAFEPVNAFNYYYGRGNRVEETVRGFAFRNQDLSFIKNTRLPGNTNFQFRLEAFNVWNWHVFTNPGQWGGLAFTNDVASPDFGRWNGSVTDPRSVQLAFRFEF